MRDSLCLCLTFSALMLLVRWQEGRPACKKTDWWGAGVFICLELGADLHMAQLMLLPLTVSCFSKIQIGFTFLVLAHLGSPGKRAVRRVCVCVSLLGPFHADANYPCERMVNLHERFTRMCIHTDANIIRSLVAKT